MKHLLLLLFVYLVFLLPSNAQNIYINEFLSSNVSINADILDFDDYSDWIELYNDEDFDVDIGNWFITDNIDTSHKIPISGEVIIPPKGYLLLWADGYNEIPGKLIEETISPMNILPQNTFILVLI